MHDDFGVDVAEKTFYNWENGKCMPDYSVIEPLCSELGITVAELMDGEDAADNSVRTYDETQIFYSQRFMLINRICAPRQGRVI